MPVIVLAVEDATCDVPATFVRPPDDNKEMDAVPIAVAVKFGFTVPSIVMTSRWAADAYVLSPPVYHYHEVRRYTYEGDVIYTPKHTHNAP